ncbi:hypothetical protein MXB_309, partial [Myxobolus squamalis]
QERNTNVGYYFLLKIEAQQILSQTEEHTIKITVTNIPLTSFHHSRIETDVDQIIPKLNETSFNKPLDFKRVYFHIHLSQNYDNPLFDTPPNDSFFDNLSYETTKRISYERPRRYISRGRYNNYSRKRGR